MAVPRPKRTAAIRGAFQPHGMTDEVRRTRALEFTAHYLDRIDLSLERIATALGSGEGNERLRLTLETIAEVFVIVRSEAERARSSALVRLSQRSRIVSASA